MHASRYTSVKPAIWGAVVGSIVTMIVGFSWGGWTTSATAHQTAINRADAAVTAALVPICLAQQKIDGQRRAKVDQLKAMSSSYQQTEFVMKAGWATFPGSEEPHRGVAEACATALLKVAEAK
jgi:hypothetical protein